MRAGGGGLRGKVAFWWHYLLWMMIELGGILNIGGFADDDGGAFFVSSDWEVKTSLFKHLYEVSCTECRVGY